MFWFIIIPQHADAFIPAQTKYLNISRHYSATTYPVNYEWTRETLLSKQIDRVLFKQNLYLEGQGEGVREGVGYKCT